MEMFYWSPGSIEAFLALSIVPVEKGSRGVFEWRVRSRGRRAIIKGKMDSAVYCLKGHYVGLLNPVHRARSTTEFRTMMASADGTPPLPPFCTKCGAPNLNACPQCQAPIEKRYPGVVPAYCGGCGKPFPWTEAALSAAKDFTDDLDLSAEEKSTLKGTFDDLTSDTARTPLAANRFRKIVNKIGPVAGGVLQKIIETVATEAAKKAMGL